MPADQFDKNAYNSMDIWNMKLYFISLERSLSQLSNAKKRCMNRFFWRESYDQTRRTTEKLTRFFYDFSY